MDEQQLRRRLKIEASEIRVTPPPDAWDAVKTRIDRRPRKLLVAAAAAAAVVIAAVAVPMILSNRQTITGVAASPHPFAEETNEALTCFFDARIKRDFDGARPCMSERLYASYNDPVEFIGPSSPNIQRFTVTDIRSDGDRLLVEALVHIGTPTEALFASTDVLTLIEEGGQWVVDSWEQGEEIPARREGRNTDSLG